MTVLLALLVVAWAGVGLLIGGGIALAAWADSWAVGRQHDRELVELLEQETSRG